MGRSDSFGRLHGDHSPVVEAAGGNVDWERGEGIPRTMGERLHGAWAAEASGGPSRTATPGGVRGGEGRRVGGAARPPPPAAPPPEGSAAAGRPAGAPPPPPLPPRAAGASVCDTERGLPQPSPGLGMPQTAHMEHQLLQDTH